MAKLVIGITTFKRPRMLEGALRAVERLSAPADIVVVVADNDVVEQAGKTVADKLATAGFRFPLSTILVTSRGFTHGRNALLAAAFADPAVGFVALMDDDQEPSAVWLAAMLRVQEATSADIVAPAVWPQFEVAAAGWATTSKVYHRDVATTGRVEMLTGDGGVLVARSAIRRIPLPWYDHAFSMTGGADTELFVRLGAVGAVFARSAEAIIRETYPASRMTVRWALTRAYRTGNTGILIQLKHLRRAEVWRREIIKIVGAFLLSPWLVLLAIGRSGQQVDALCKIARAGGKLAALLGSRHQEYVITHGG